MGNQQERSLAWLAGIMDGEGTIGFQVYTKPDGSIRITPMVSLINSDERLLAEAKSILDDLVKDSKMAKVRWCNHQAQHPKGFETRKICKTLRVDGAATRLILEPLTPFLRSAKKDRAEAVLKYLDSRRNGLLVRDSAGRLQRTGYRLSEIAIVVSARSHPRAKSSEAICSAPNVVVG